MRLKKDEYSDIMGRNLKDFEEWICGLDDDFISVVGTIFGKDDPRGKVCNKSLRKRKLQKIMLNV